jgi:hypothetical protein
VSGGRNATRSACYADKYANAYANLQENRPSGLIKSHLNPLITWRTPATITIMASEIGKNTFQPSRIN